MKKNLTILICVICTLGVNAQEIKKDTLKVVDLEEILVVSSPKESSKFRQQSLAVSMLSPSDIQNKQLTSLKNIAAYIPNVIMPDYGSKLTSSIYIRGIGSRINSPAIGMYVDNIPYLDKSAYDISLFGVERIDVLRGPQGTLYGKNTMGGLVKVYTRNPFTHAGTDVKLSAASKDGHWGVTAQHNAKVNDEFAFNVGGYYEGSNGFFRNVYLDKKVDVMKAGGLRTRLIYKPSRVLTVDYTASYDNSDEGGYAYGLYDTQSGTVGNVETNREGNYRRGVLNMGLGIEANWDRLVLSSITGFQNLHDRMFMDQDYSSADVFTLEQKQKLNTITEEITLKNKTNGFWQWTTGAFMSHQSLNTHAPVVFRKDGMDMLQRTINGYFPESISGMTLNLGFNATEMSIPADFDTPVNNVAVFHQSNFKMGNWTLTLGGRLEHERMKNIYDVATSAPYLFTASYRNMPVKVEQTAETRLMGELKDNYTQFLPKVALMYQLDRHNNLYASVSKGYRSGGYNLQMISDVAQAGLQNSMYTQIEEGVAQGLQKFVAMGMPQMIIDRIVDAMSQYMVEKDIDVKNSITYKPEVSWNYELGSHFSLLNGALQGDAALFYMQIRNQQITRFVNSGFGRILVNAGKSKSFGAELNLTGQVNSNFTLFGTLGYTHASFVEYNTASEGTEGNDYKDNFVPFVPTYTCSFGGDYRIPTRGKLHAVTLGANLLGTGRIYWSEDNSQMQHAYAQLGAHALLDFGLCSLDLWGKNLTNTKYNVFCFKNGNTSTSQFFGQRGKPLQVGVDLRFHF